MSGKDELLEIECKLARLTTDFAKCMEGITQDLTPVICRDAEYIYSRMEQLTGILCDLRNTIYPMKDRNIGDVVWELKI